MKCPYCKKEIEIDEDSIEVDADVESFEDGTARIVLTVKVRCPECDRIIAKSHETVDVEVELPEE